MKVFKFILFLFIASVISGCASNKGYLGEPRPESELASISQGEKLGGSNLFSSVLYLSAIDDLVVGDYFKGHSKKVYILPGERKITYRYIVSGAYYPGTRPEEYPAIIISAKAGQIYTTRFSEESEKLYIWVENSLGEIVAGKVPAEYIANKQRNTDSGDKSPSQVR
ncbi:MAG: hypothetical protein K9K86_06285 [Pseudomonadales bacterium]|nr:hypothetical protein [Pseudomonadales bacterium]